MSLFNPITFECQNYTTEYIMGRAVETEDGVPFNITGSWQPAEGEDLQTLPEGRRNQSAYVLITSTDLKIDQQTIDGQAQRRTIVKHDGFDYEVVSLASWQNKILPHYNYLCVRNKEKEVGKSG